MTGVKFSVAVPTVPVPSIGARDTPFYLFRLAKILTKIKGFALFIGLSGLLKLMILIECQQQIDWKVFISLTGGKRVLSANGKNIKSLNGLEMSAFSDLSSIDLRQNQISEITQLKGMKSLTKLHLDGNLIKSLDALLDLTSLKELYLSGNEIKYQSSY
jgi:hypothetical protein